MTKEKLRQLYYLNREIINDTEELVELKIKARKSKNSGKEKLIEEQGRMDLPGRPLLYGTTADFLRCFGVSGLGELPPLPQKDGEGMDEPTLQEAVEEAAMAEEVPAE